MLSNALIYHGYRFDERGFYMSGTRKFKNIWENQLSKVIHHRAKCNDKAYLQTPDRHPATTSDTKD